MDPDINKNMSNTIRFYYSFEQEAKTILDYLKIRKPSNIGILYLKHSGVLKEVNEYLLPNIKRLNIEIKYNESYEFGQMDFKNLVSRLYAKQPEMLIILGYGNSYPQIFKAMKAYKLKNQIEILGGWGFIAPNGLTESDLESIVVAVPKYIVEKEKESKFYEKYFKKFHKEPSFDAAFAYDAINFLYFALRKYNFNFDEFVKVLKKEDFIYRGEMGKYILKKDGDLIIEMTIAKYSDGKLVTF
jgi:ABC-type branched-subunit amino acid transport system substrate-binding protein